MAAKFYRFIHNSMGILLAWGVLNVLAGIVGAIFNRDKFKRQFWLQCAGWGLVNSIIAALSQSSYRKRINALPADPETSPEETDTAESAWKKHARTIQLILLVNVFLDAIYVLVGGFIRQDGVAQDKQGKAGMGFAFIVQGVFLFIFDGVLTFIIARRWRKNQGRNLTTNLSM